MLYINIWYTDAFPPLYQFFSIRFSKKLFLSFIIFYFLISITVCVLHVNYFSELFLRKNCLYSSYCFLGITKKLYEVIYLIILQFMHKRVFFILLYKNNSFQLCTLFRSSRYNACGGVETVLFGPNTVVRTVFVSQKGYPLYSHNC